MARYIFTSLRVALLTILLVGVIYPLVMTGLAQLLFPRQAHGSLVLDGKSLKGSALIGQSFTRPGYFHPRPSAAGDGYDATASSGSNLAPTSAALAARVMTDTRRLRQENPGLTTIPVDMVTTSGSGLDPDITPANAFAQVARVARARGVDEAIIHHQVARQIQERQFCILGESRVNVLQLNKALDMALRSATR